MERRRLVGDRLETAVSTTAAVKIDPQGIGRLYSVQKCKGRLGIHVNTQTFFFFYFFGQSDIFVR